MKISFDIDCTPAEARAFLGLPDTEALQQEMLEKMRGQLEAMNPEEMMKLWMPGGTDGLQQMQQAFMAQMAQFTGQGKK
jgi:hypothetical protein